MSDASAGNPRNGRRQPIERVDKAGPGGCWLWLGASTLDGYGQFSLQGRRWMAHRYFYEHYVGPIPEGLHIDHLCRNPPCVNPDHLEPVTPRENMARGIHPAAVAIRFDVCNRGHALTEDNLYRNRARPTERRCRTCERARRKAAALRE